MLTFRDLQLLQASQVVSLVSVELLRAFRNMFCLLLVCLPYSALALNYGQKNLMTRQLSEFLLLMTFTGRGGVTGLTTMNWKKEGIRSSVTGRRSAGCFSVSWQRRRRCNEHH